MSDPIHRKVDVFKSIGKDPKLRAEILEKISKRQGQLRGAGAGLEALELPGAPSDIDRANDMLNGVDIVDVELEAIVLLEGRPVIRILNNDIVEGDVPTETLKDQLDSHSQVIRSVVKSVGRIELNGHRRLPWVGTGWVIDDDIMVTNRHVAKEFGFFTGTSFNFLPGVFGTPIEARVDFREEHGNPIKEEFKISEILYIEPEGGPDIALLRVDWASGPGPRDKLVLWENPIDTDRQIAVIGYPARDTRTNIPSKMDDIFDRIYNVKRLAPGLVLGASPQAGFLTHDCTTLGGNSGSSVVDLESGKAIALHFAGREQDANFAVLAPVIQSRLNEVRTGVTLSGLGGILNNEVIEETPTVGEMADREGYDPDFLDIRVDLPGMTPTMLSNLAPVVDQNDGELKYTHYSVLMNSQRRIAYYAVVNIDGNRLHGIPRTSDKWSFDPRISMDHQVGNSLYKSNPLDRGHLARRLDPSWGATRDIAELGVEDSFFYTNAAPQHLSLNRKTWLGLEDHILSNTGKFDLKVTVFSGPVFRDNDQVYRSIKIPNEFWKVVAMMKPNDDGGEATLSVTGYVLSQRSLIDDLEFVFGEHQGYQVKIDVIEELTGLDFGILKEADPLSAFSDAEAVNMGATRRGRRLFSLNDIVL